MKYLVFDVITGGVSPKDDQLHEIAYMLLDEDFNILASNAFALTYASYRVSPDMFELFKFDPLRLSKSPVPTVDLIRAMALDFDTATYTCLTKEVVPITTRAELSVGFLQRVISELSNVTPLITSPNIGTHTSVGEWLLNRIAFDKTMDLSTLCRMYGVSKKDESKVVVSHLYPDVTGAYDLVADFGTALAGMPEDILTTTGRIRQQFKVLKFFKDKFFAM